jgi:hypothetical protein
LGVRFYPRKTGRNFPFKIPPDVEISKNYSTNENGGPLAAALKLGVLV